MKKRDRRKIFTPALFKQAIHCIVANKLTTKEAAEYLNNLIEEVQSKKPRGVKLN